MAPRPEVTTDSPPTLGMSLSLVCIFLISSHCVVVTSSNSHSPSSLDDKTEGKDSAILPAYSTVDLVNEDPAEEDPWDLPELKDTGVKWSGEAPGHCQHAVWMPLR